MESFLTKIESLTESLKDFDWSHLFSSGSIFTSLFVIIAIIVIRGFLIRYVRRDTEILANDQRRWIIRIKNTAAILIVLAIILIWAPQLRTFAISIAAFGVALVVALKEMILCLTGAVMRTTSQPLKVGEWITIDGITGEVIDMDAFAFRLQEVDMEGKSYQFTGRTISVPNSKLFTANVINSNFYKAYIFEDVRIKTQFTDLDPAPAMEALRRIAEAAFAPYRADAIAFNRKIRRRSGSDIGSAEPLYDLVTTDLGHYLFHVRFFLPTAIASNVGLEVSTAFLSEVHRMRHAAKDTKPETAPEEEPADPDQKD